MPTPTLSLFLNSTTPAPLNGYQNAKPQSDGGSPLTSVSLCVPNTGGVIIKTASYTATAADCGTLIVFNSSSTLTLTLPTSVPFAKWKLSVANIGSGNLSVTPGAFTLDGSSSSLSLGQLQSASIATDGSNYYCERGLAPATPSIIGFIIGSGSSGSNVGPMLVAAHAGSVSKCVVITKGSDGSVALTFRIKRNGTDVFTSDPTVAAGTASGTVSTFTSLTSSPLRIAAGDVFSIDITTGSSSWQFTAQLE
jgi:hypothetical protein